METEVTEGMNGFEGYHCHLQALPLSLLPVYLEMKNLPSHGLTTVMFHPGHGAK